MIQWLERLELFLYRKAAGVVSTTQAFRHNLVERGIDPEKIAVITNGVDTTRFRPQPKDAELAWANLFLFSSSFLLRHL